MEFMTNINDRISTLETKNTVLNQQHLIPGQIPVATGLLPQATGLVPQATGLMPQATGLRPQNTKTFASPPIKTIQQNMVPLNTSSPVRQGLNSVGNYYFIPTGRYIKNTLLFFQSVINQLNTSMQHHSNTANSSLMNDQSASGSMHPAFNSPPDQKKKGRKRKNTSSELFIFSLLRPVDLSLSISRSLYNLR